jgi:hypothetical protein
MSLEEDARENEDALSDADEPLHVKKDSPDSPSWQKRYGCNR